MISNLYDLTLTFANDGEDFMVPNSDNGCPLGYFEYLQCIKYNTILFTSNNFLGAMTPTLTYVWHNEEFGKLTKTF